jgi:N-acetylmuramoyl-L-alanine amidase
MDALPLLPDEYRAARAAFAGRDEVQIRGWQARVGTGVDGDPGPATRAALARLAPPEPEAPALVVIPRSGWGARAYRGRTSALGTPRRIVLHHTAGHALPLTREAGVVEVRAIQRAHQTKWADIGYHYLLAQDGTWFEGRQRHDARTLALGAHVSGHNPGSIGICVMGYFHAPKNHRMTEAATEALRAMVADLRRQYGPLPVVGHRDLGATACPGDHLYPLVKSLTP